MSITAAGFASAAAWLRRRPSASRKIFFPFSWLYSSTNARTVRLPFDCFSSAGLFPRDARAPEDAGGGDSAGGIDPGGGPAGAALHVREQVLAVGVEERRDIRAAVPRDLGLRVEDRLDVPEVGVAILPLPREG